MVEDDLASTSLEVDLLDLNMLICFGARANGKRIRSPAAGRDREHGGAIAGDCPGISQAAQPRAFNGGLRMLDARRICCAAISRLPASSKGYVPIEHAIFRDPGLDCRGPVLKVPRSAHDYRRGPRQWAACNATTSRDGPDCLRVRCRAHDGRGEKAIKMIDRQVLG